MSEHFGIKVDVNGERKWLQSMSGFAFGTPSLAHARAQAQLCCEGIMGFDEVYICKFGFTSDFEVETVRRVEES